MILKKWVVFPTLKIRGKRRFRGGKRCLLNKKNRSVITTPLLNKNEKLIITINYVILSYIQGVSPCMFKTSQFPTYLSLSLRFS